ncbi:hypothetical protein EJ02DRAFT_435622 [Clathrospora elynae]|uniref:CENP-V/GFA domain-containing protein n=1 Tax=Clathrospora elynae TaxID=706981 RepID=A0A6A5SKU6_9PLEO|nr:hypothetical protein EJ02DRAFT_435622 [Clathrospora elynae]
MASPTDDAFTLMAHCLCKVNIFKTTISRSNLPLPAHVCHCHSCRHTTGALYSSFTSWSEPRASVDVSQLKALGFSPNVNLLFCPACLSPMFWVWPQDPTHPLGVYTKLLGNINEDLIRFVDHEFVGDTGDGRASVWLRHPNTDDELTGYSASKEDAVSIRCKCKGVEFVLRRNQSYPTQTKEELQWNIDLKMQKYLVVFCGCNSCRLQCGIDVLNWMYAEMKYISFINNARAFPNHMEELNKLIDAKEPIFGTLTYYTSSPGVHRYFSSNCSACIFHANGERPTVVDIAVGVLEASDGARAEGMLSWTYGANLINMEDGNGGWREGLFCQQIYEEIKEEVR